MGITKKKCKYIYIQPINLGPEQNHPDGTAKSAWLLNSAVPYNVLLPAFNLRIVNVDTRTISTFDRGPRKVANVIATNAEGASIPINGWEMAAEQLANLIENEVYRFHNCKALASNFGIWSSQ